MDIDLIKFGIAALVGGLLTPLMGYLKQLRQGESEDKKTNLEGFSILQDAWEREFSKLNEKVRLGEIAEAQCLERYHELNEKFKSLRASWEVHRKSFPDLPLPMWMKDTNGVMLALNDAYETEFLIPIGKRRSHYIGNTDEVIWGKEIAESFRENDMKVKGGLDEIRVFENVEVHGGLFDKFDIIKYAKKIDGILVGFGGIALPKHVSLQIKKSENGRI